MSDELKKQKEMALFQRFLHVSPFQIDEKSIVQGCPPAPDIICREKGGEVLQFELTEIISGSAAQGLAELSLGIQIEACLKNYSRQQEFIERYAGKQIWLEFFEYHGNESGLKAKKRKVTRKVILGAANHLFDLLLADKNRGKTKIHPFCPHDTNLAKILSEALICERPDFNPTLFETGGAIPYEPVDELLLRRIFWKCSRRYSRSGIHLLAYFDFQPPDFRSDWEKRLTRLCKKFSGKSQFNHLWLFSTARDTIFYKYPTAQTSD